jgi:hypothetical protein
MTDLLKDPVFIADAKKRRLDVKSPRSGQELQALLARIYTDTPAPVVGRLRKIMNPG